MLLLFSLTVFSQQKEKKINFTILDASFDLNDVLDNYISGEYSDNYIPKSPISVGVNVGFEYPVNKYLGLESGLRISYYIKRMGEKETDQKRDIEGVYWGPYLSSKINLVPYQDGNRALYVENRFSLVHATMNLPSDLNMKRRYEKMIFLYNLSLGLQCKVSEGTFLNFMLGYNSFNASKIKKFEKNEMKSKIPFHFGVGVSLVI